MKIALLRPAVLLAATLACAGNVLAGAYLIHDGDRVVFLGDSITEQRLYTTYPCCFGHEPRTRRR